VNQDSGAWGGGFVTPPTPEPQTHLVHLQVRRVIPRTMAGTNAAIVLTPGEGKCHLL